MGIVFTKKEESIKTLITGNDVVLDVGFWGQGTKIDHPDWVHGKIKSRAKDVYGIDLDYDESRTEPKDHYKKVGAENFDFDVDFDVIYAGDLIEHLSNPGLFFDACSRNIKDGGRLVIGTPNCYGFFNMAGKLTRREPVVNSDHTCYFSEKTFKTLARKNGWIIDDTHFIYSLPIHYKESIKKRILNVFYKFFSLFTTKYMENFVFVLKKSPKS